MIDTQKIWEDYLRVAKEMYEPRKPTEMTIREFAEQSKMPERSAREFLQRLVKEGKMNRRTVLEIMGAVKHRVVVYEPVVESEKKP